MSLFKTKLPDIQPLKGPDPVPEAFGACIVCGKSTSDKNYMDKPLCADCSLYGQYAKAKAAKPNPETDLRYRPIALLHGGVAVVDDDTWAMLAECKTEMMASRICVALDEYDKNHPVPF